MVVVLFWGQVAKKQQQVRIMSLMVHNLPTKIVQFSRVQESSLILIIYWVLSASWHLIIEGTRFDSLTLLDT